MQKIVFAAVSRLVELGSVEEENRDIYEYGLHILISTATNLAITIALGFIFGAPLETFLMFISFTVLRSAAGGYHAKSFIGCIAVSAISIAAAMATIKFVPDVAVLPIAIVLMALSLAAIFAFAPAEHPNRPLNEHEVDKFRKFSRMISVIFVIAATALFFLRIPRCGLAISLGLTLSGAATTFAVLTKGRR